MIEVDPFSLPFLGAHYRTPEQPTHTSAYYVDAPARPLHVPHCENAARHPASLPSAAAAARAQDVALTMRRPNI